VPIVIYYMKGKSKTIQQMPHSDSSTVRVSHTAKIKLVKIGARLALKDGDQRSIEEVIDVLIREYERAHKEEFKE
jgi:hypothetical protein